MIRPLYNIINSPTTTQLNAYLKYWVRLILTPKTIVCSHCSTYEEVEQWVHHEAPTTHVLNVFHICILVHMLLLFTYPWWGLENKKKKVSVTVYNKTLSSQCNFFAIAVPMKKWNSEYIMRLLQQRGYRIRMTGKRISNTS
jgi:hypothetical protein